MWPQGALCWATPAGQRWGYGEMQKGEWRGVCVCVCVHACVCKIIIILPFYTGTPHTESHLILTTDDSSLRGYSYPCSWKRWGSERLNKWPKETQHSQHPGSPGFQTARSFLRSGPMLLLCLWCLLHQVLLWGCLLDGSVWACLSLLKGAGCSPASHSRPAQSLLLTNERKGERAKAPASFPLFPKPAPVPTQEAASPRCWGLARGRGRQVTLPAKCRSALLAMNVERDLSVVRGQENFPAPCMRCPCFSPQQGWQGAKDNPPLSTLPKCKGLRGGFREGQ